MASLRSALWLLAISAPVVLADVPHYGEDDYTAYNAGEFEARPFMNYKTVDFNSPRFMINTWEKDRVSNETHIIMSPGVAGQKHSPLVFDASDMSLVYLDPSWVGGAACNYQEHNGQMYLTFWSGKDYHGWGSGGGVMLDNQYTMYRNVTTSSDLKNGGDSHEFQLTHDGGALLNNYHNNPWDLSAAGGPKDSVLHDCAFQEVDIETGEVRFTWRATDHFDFSESFDAFGLDGDGGWDWFHENSLQKTLEGDYLISSRHLRMLALINGTDGSKIWQLGGKNNKFKDLSNGKATNFGFQHNARFVDLENPNEITFFDNRAMFMTSPTPGCKTACSRGVRVKLDYEAMTVELVNEFHHPKSVQAWAQGGIQPLPNGGAMIGWGTVPSFTEVTAEGDTVMEFQASPWSTAAGGHGGTTFYRVYKYNYVAYPPWPPAIAAENGKVYVSWNGATEVKQWTVAGGPSSTDIQALDLTVPRNGFETEIEIPSGIKVARVSALDINGNILGSSDMVDVSSGEVMTVNVQLD